MERKIERADHRFDNVVEIPIGEYDAVRTLRHALQQAERGEFTDVIIIYQKKVEEEDAHDLWCCWSDMQRYDILWMQRWFNSWLNRRYFGMWHEDDDD